MKIAMFNAHINDAVRQSGKSRRDILAMLRAKGVTALEYGIQELEDLEAVKAELAEFDLAICSIYEHCHFEEGGPVNLRIVDVAEELGVDKLLIVPGFLQDGISKELVLENCVQGLRDLINDAQDKEITITIEPFDSEDSVMPDVESLLFFGNQLAELAYTFDTGNFIYSGEDVLLTFDQLSQRIVHVHMKDRTDQAIQGANPTILPNGQKLYATAVGQGIMPMATIIKKLKEMNYQGYLTIEHFDAVDYLQTMLDSVDWLNQELK